MITGIFPIPLLIEKLDLKTDDIALYCRELRDKTKTADVSNRGGWQSPPLTGVHNVLNPLFDEILKLAETYRNFCYLKKPLSIKDAWININKRRDYNVRHVHPRCMVSGTYYVKTNPKSGDLHFHHPADFSMTYTWDDKLISNFKEHNSGAWLLPPVENQLVMFPSWLQHSVEENLSDEERISIAFNLDFNQNI